MKKFLYSFTGLVLAAGAAHAQPAPAPEGDVQGAEASAAEAADAAESVAPTAPATAGTVSPTDAEIDSFAKATVKLQAIQADAAITADQKQPAMAAAVTAEGLDPAKYNAIGKALQTDAELRAKVQTAMARHAGHTDG